MYEFAKLLDEAARGGKRRLSFTCKRSLTGGQGDWDRRGKTRVVNRPVLQRYDEASLLMEGRCYFRPFRRYEQRLTNCVRVLRSRSSHRGKTGHYIA